MHVEVIRTSRRAVLVSIGGIYRWYRWSQVEVAGNVEVPYVGATWFPVDYFSEYDLFVNLFPKREYVNTYEETWYDSRHFMRLARLVNDPALALIG